MEEILKDTVILYNEYINRVISGCDLIISELRSNNMDKAVKLILDLSEGIQWIDEINKRFKINSIENYLDINPIIDTLQEVNDALIQNDSILLADIFEYDIQPFFKEFNSIKID